MCTSLKDGIWIWACYCHLFTPLLCAMSKSLSAKFNFFAVRWASGCSKRCIKTTTIRANIIQFPAFCRWLLWSLGWGGGAEEDADLCACWFHHRTASHFKRGLCVITGCCITFCLGFLCYEFVCSVQEYLCRAEMVPLMPCDSNSWLNWKKKRNVSWSKDFLGVSDNASVEKGPQAWPGDKVCRR